MELISVPCRAPPLRRFFLGRQNPSWMALPGGMPLVEERESPPRPSIGFLVAGRVLAEVETMNGRGRAAHRRPQTRRAVIGAAQLLTDEPFRTTITALRVSELLAIPAERAEALMRENPEFSSTEGGPRRARPAWAPATPADQLQELHPRLRGDACDAASPCGMLAEDGWPGRCGALRASRSPFSASRPTTSPPTLATSALERRRTTMC